MKNYTIVLVTYFSLNKVDTIARYGTYGWEPHRLEPDYILLRKEIEFKGYQGTLKQYVETMGSLVESIMEMDTGEIVYSLEEGWLPK